MPSNALLVFDRTQMKGPTRNLYPTFFDEIPASEGVSSRPPEIGSNVNHIEINNNKGKQDIKRKAALQFGPSGIALLALIGFGVLAAFFYFAFYAKGTRYDYSCPLSSMSMGLAAMWFDSLLFGWWLLCKRKSKMMLQVWSFLGALFAVEGLLALIAYAVAKNEKYAAGLGLLWICSGVLCAMMCAAQKKANTNEPTEVQQPSDKIEEGSEATASNGKRVRCSKTQFWLNFIEIFLLAWLFVFSTGIVVQAAFTVYDTLTILPPGKIYSIDANGVELKLHLHCFGNGMGNKTVVFAHGGGSNSASMLALAEELAGQHGVRACVYDRLGYGFSPSFYTGAEQLPNSGVILSRLLEEAGEEGPFVCAGHSAGAESCLWFAHERPDVEGVAMMDGYPDLIRAGATRPGVKPSSPMLYSLQGIAMVAGATGFTRGAVGNPVYFYAALGTEAGNMAVPGSSFVPAAEKDTMIALYGQIRFWFAQYWDVKADFDKSEEQRLYRSLGGTMDEEGIVRYGGELKGVKVLVLPAAATTNKTCDGSDKDKNQHCCGQAVNSTRCQNEITDSEKYRRQALLYASTLSSDVPGSVIFAPEGSDHAFVYHQDYYKWIALQVANKLL